MKTRTLGNNGLEVSEIGLGTMTVGKTYSIEDRKNAIDLIRKAKDYGVTFFDTAECYGPSTGLNEELVGEAIEPFRNEIKLATKTGVRFIDGHMEIDSSPRRIREAIEGSLKRLRSDHIDLYYTHRVDPKIPIEEVAGVMSDLYEEGKILNWGISEPSMETLRRAHAVFPVSAIESEYSMMWREPEESLFPTLEELGIGLVPYRPLARGFLTDVDEGMFLQDAKNTRFDEKYLKANMALKDLLRKLAQEKQMTPSQLALSWILHQRPYIVPIPGTSKIENLENNIGASEVELTADEINQINELLNEIEIQGERYDPQSENGQSVRK